MAITKSLTLWKLSVAVIALICQHLGGEWERREREHREQVIAAPK